MILKIHHYLLHIFNIILFLIFIIYIFNYIFTYFLKLQNMFMNH